MASDEEWTETIRAITAWHKKDKEDTEKGWIRIICWILFAVFIEQIVFH